MTQTSQTLAARLQQVSADSPGDPTVDAAIRRSYRRGSELLASLPGGVLPTDHSKIIDVLALAYASGYHEAISTVEAALSGIV